MGATAGVRRRTLASLKAQALASGEDPDGDAAYLDVLGALHKFPGARPDAEVFLEALDERDINWTPSMEVDSLDSIGEYAVRGFGVGLGVGIPGKEPQAGLREIRLQGFPPLVVGAIHQGPLKPIAKEFLKKAKKRARSLTKRS